METGYVRCVLGLGRIHPPLTEDGSEPRQKLSVVDQIVYNTLLKHEVSSVRHENRKFIITLGNLELLRPVGCNLVGVKYKEEYIGVCVNETVLFKFKNKIQDYYARLSIEDKPERIKRAEEREARLLEILKEVISQ